MYVCIMERKIFIALDLAVHFQCGITYVLLPSTIVYSQQSNIDEMRTEQNRNIPSNG